MDTHEFSHSADGEIFSGDTFPSREAALAAGLSFAEPGRPVFTGRHEAPPHPRAFMPGIDEIFDTMAERAYEEHDDLAEGWPELTEKDQLNQIQAHLDAIADLVQTFDPPTFYHVVKIEKHTAPEA